VYFKRFVFFALVTVCDVQHTRDHYAFMQQNGAAKMAPCLGYSCGWSGLQTKWYVAEVWPKWLCGRNSCYPKLVLSSLVNM